MDIKVYYLYFYMHESLCCGDIFIIIFEWMAGFYDVVIQTQMYKVHKIYILCKKVFCWIEVKRNRYGNVLRELFFFEVFVKSNIFRPRCFYHNNNRLELQAKVRRNPP